MNDRIVTFNSVPKWFVRKPEIEAWGKENLPSGDWCYWYRGEYNDWTFESIDEQGRGRTLAVTPYTLSLKK